MRTRPLALTLTVFGILLLGAQPWASQSADQTATQFYMSYKAAFGKAKKIDELLPFMSKAKLEEIKQLPAKDWPMAFEMMKDLYVFKGEKVVGEKLTATGATLQVEAVDPNNKKYKATVTLVKEGKVWKFHEEDWTPA
jgi:hypothetical protein